MNTKKELIEITSKLVSFKTVSPVGDEYLCQKYLESLLKDVNAKVQIIAKDKKRPNVIGEIGNGKKSLMIALHMDVVPAGEGWGEDPFIVREKDGYLYGRGVIDDKGPYAVAYLAVKKFFKENPDFNGKIYLAAVADEENDNEYGIKYLIEKKFKADAALIPDGGWIDQLDIGEKGCLQIKVRSFGKQEHSALQENGNNAIVNLVQFINELENKKWAKKYDKDFSNVKVNYSLINGGDFPNIVPANAQAQMDIRFPLGLTSKYILEELNKIKKKLEAKRKNLRYEFEIVYKTEPHKVEKKELVASFMKAAKNLKMKMRTITLPGNSVGKELTQAGIPSIVHWPASELTPHEPDERVSINEFMQSINLYYEFLKEYFQINT